MFTFTAVAIDLKNVESVRNHHFYPVKYFFFYSKRRFIQFLTHHKSETSPVIERNK